MTLYEAYIADGARYTYEQMKQSYTATRLTLPSSDIPIPHTGIGLVAPFDFMLDAECWRWLPPNVPLFVTRTPMLENTTVTVELATEVSGELAVVPAVKSLLSARPASVAYACTSGSFVDGVKGEHHLQQTMINAGAPFAATTSGALVQALQFLGIERLAIATPYNEELTHLLADFLDEAGFDVVSSGYLDKEHGIAYVPYESVKKLAKAVDNPEAEAIFFSCTNLHTFDIIEELEKSLGKPVLSANQVTMWAALRAAKLPMPVVPHHLFRATLHDTLHPKLSVRYRLPKLANPFRKKS
jgi:maleate isomerase